MKALLDLISKRFFLIAVTVMMSFSVVAFSQDSAIPQPELLSSLLNFLVTIPKFGPAISIAVYWIGAISALFTALTVFVLTVLKIPQVALRFKGAHDLADKIEVFSQKIGYYLKYLSIFNAQKEVKKEALK